MAKARLKISPRIAAMVKFEANRLCCICKQNRPNMQIHHLDGNNTNNQMNNLVLLCADHHHEASVKNGLGRKLSAEELILFRVELHKEVQAQRQQLGQKGQAPDRDVLQTLALFEVTKLGYQIASAHTKWEKVAQPLQDIGFYADPYDWRVKQKILEIYSRLAAFTRHDLPLSLIKAIQNGIICLLPFTSIVGLDHRKLTTEDFNLIERSADVGANIAYDGAKYLSDLKVVDEGGYILFWILKYASINGNSQIKKYALKSMQQVIDGAKDNRDRKFQKGIEWMEYLKADALSDWNAEPVPLPPNSEPY